MCGNLRELKGGKSLNKLLNLESDRALCRHLTRAFIGTIQAIPCKKLCKNKTRFCVFYSRVLISPTESEFYSNSRSLSSSFSKYKGWKRTLLNAIYDIYVCFNKIEILNRMIRNTSTFSICVIF